MAFFPLFVVILLGCIVPGILLSNIDGEFSFNFFVSFLIVLWCSFRLGYTSLKGRRRLTLMLFYVFLYVFMGVQPLLSIWNERFPHSEFLFTDQMIGFSICMVILGLAGFEIGYFRFRKDKKVNFRQAKSLLPFHPRPISLDLIWIVSSIITILFALAIVKYGPDIFLGLRGGGFLLSDSEGPQIAQTEYQLVIFGLRGMTATLLFIILYLNRIKYVLPKNKLWSLKWALIYLIFLNVLISNPLNAPRLWSGCVILTSLFISMRWKGSRSFLNWATASSLGMLLLFSGTDPRVIFSQQLLRGEQITISNTGKEIGRAIQNLPADANFDAFQMIFYTTAYTEKMGFSWGNQLLLPAFFWVPRSIWTSKPLGSPDIVAAHANFYSLNVSSPLWSEGYINFGVPGVFLFLYVFGYFARRSDNTLAQPSIMPPFATIISCFFAANTFILLRGDLTSGTMYLQVIALFSFLFLLILQGERKASTPALGA